MLARFLWIGKRSTVPMPSRNESLILQEENSVTVLKIATPFVTCLLGCSIASRWNRWIVLGLAVVALVMEYALGYWNGRMYGM